MHLLTGLGGPPASPTPADPVERLGEAAHALGLSMAVDDHKRGPRTDTFVLRLYGGTTVAKVKRVLPDLALAMGAREPMLRVEGELVLEFFRADPDPVLLRDLLASNPVGPHEFIVGVGTTGQVVTCSLKGMTHAAIAGCSGSGKSVALHAILTGLLSTTSAEALRVVLIDPKQLELTRYMGLPHLACEPVTNARKAGMVLSELAAEVERRYSAMRAAGTGDPLRLGYPVVLVVFDEYGDVCCDLRVKAEVTRLGQKARAAGVHLVIATQRPSVDVLDGTIKANFPTRLVLRTASLVDSRVALDRPGAEKLLGAGDALLWYGGELRRVQVPLTTEEDVYALKRHYSGQQT